MYIQGVTLLPLNLSNAGSSYSVSLNSTMLGCTLLPDGHRVDGGDYLVMRVCNLNLAGHLTLYSKIIIVESHRNNLQRRNYSLIIEII